MDPARRRAEEYLKLPGMTLECKREFVDNAFLLEQVFRALMREADCRAMTIRRYMSTIMPISETTACLPLSTLNDDGDLMAEKMPGFHWITVDGDYLREAGYALKKIPIEWECLG